MFVRNHWARFRPGDMGFFPPPVEHAVSAAPESLPGPSQLAFHDCDPAVRVFCGAKIDVIDAPPIPRRTNAWSCGTAPPAPRSRAGWHDVELFDVVFAPCGVEHGTSSVTGEALWGGFAAPPPLDLYTRTPYYNPPGTFAEVPFGRLDA